MPNMESIGVIGIICMLSLSFYVKQIFYHPRQIGHGLPSASTDGRSGSRAGRGEVAGMDRI